MDKLIVRHSEDIEYSNVSIDRCLKSAGSIDDQVHRLNHLIIVSDFVDLDDLDNGYIAVAQKAMLCNSRPIDMAIKQLSYPVSIEAFYNIRILNNADGLIEEQVRADLSGSRRYLIRNEEGKHLLFDKMDGNMLSRSVYSLTELIHLKEQGAQGRLFVKEFESLYRSVNPYNPF